uniref:Peptidase C1A papain C-terminal domain-containing protein n=1 Tax=viral metagenome TaxID=1070528 RepID=A0A6C0DC88_9ZZZZ
MYKLNYKFQKEDSRDLQFDHKLLPTNSVTNYNLNITKIYDQGQLGSCVSNAIALVINYINNTILPSRLYIYFNGRAISIDENIRDDTGLVVRDGCKSVSKYSVCSEINWPYNINVYSIMPSLSSYNSTYNLPNFTYYALTQTATAIQAALQANNPVIFGFTVYSSFMSRAVASTGIVPMPNTHTETIAGGHCTVMCGFNSVTKMFKCVNSWGTNWGDRGFFYMPYAYILNPSLTSDLWIIKYDLPPTKPTKINRLTNKNIIFKLKK